MAVSLARRDATYIKVRRAGQIVTIAIAVNTDGHREVLGMATGARTFWTDFPRSLAQRGLRGVKLVISDAHVGLKAAASRVLGAAAQTAECISCATCWLTRAMDTAASQRPTIV